LSYGGYVSLFMIWIIKDNNNVGFTSGNDSKYLFEYCYVALYFATVRLLGKLSDIDVIVPFAAIHHSLYTITICFYYYHY
jgi:hypothetical protein